MEGGDKLLSDTGAKMDLSLEALDRSMGRIRTGRAQPELLDDIQVDYYGTPTSLSAIATISVEGGRSLLVRPWESSLAEDIAREIRNSDLGLNPSTNEGVVRLDLPPLSEEIRLDMVKLARKEAEKARVAVRNQRRDSLNRMGKGEGASKDEQHAFQNRMQKLTDSFVAKIDERLAAKEKQLLEF